MDPICQEVVRRYEERMTPIYSLTNGGELRAARGNLVELLVKDCCELIQLEHRKGSLDFQKISVGLHTKKHQVDGHIYKDGVPVLFVEAKAYLDACYYERACNDFKLMKMAHPNVPCIVVSLEDSLSGETKIFTDAVFDNVCDGVFFLCDGKRSSTRPLYRKEFQKAVQVDRLVEYLRSVARSS